MKTLEEQLEFIFGKSTESFDPTKLPLQVDVIRRWINVYDKRRGTSRQLNKKQKGSIINEVLNELINLWISLSKDVCTKIYVRTILIKLTGEAQHYIKNTNRKEDKDWIKREKER